jgi:hypothetical protein
MKKQISSPSKKPAFPGKQTKSTNSAIVSDIGIVKKTKQAGKEKDSNGEKEASLALEDSFEKFYNKDLDLEEDQVPVVIYELNESALNFIS